MYGFVEIFTTNSLCQKFSFKTDISLSSNVSQAKVLFPKCTSELFSTQFFAPRLKISVYLVLDLRTNFLQPALFSIMRRAGIHEQDGGASQGNHNFTVYCMWTSGSSLCDMGRTC